MRARIGVWERLLELIKERADGADLGMDFSDGTNIRVHPKAGARKASLLGGCELFR